MEKKEKNQRLSLALLQIHIILWLPHIQSTTIITLQVAAQTLHHNKDVRNKSDCLSVQIRATKVDQLKLYAIVFISFLYFHTHKHMLIVFRWLVSDTNFLASLCQRLPTFASVCLCDRWQYSGNSGPFGLPGSTLTKLEFQLSILQNEIGSHLSSPLF